MRAWLLSVVMVSSAAAFAQDCTQKCGNTVSACVGNCRGEQQCAGKCADRMQDCMAHCTIKPDKQASKGKCLGANGKTTPCPDYSEKKSKKKVAEPDEEYPNKEAKDLAKDPNFKVQL